MSHRIEYQTIDGGMIIEFADESRALELEAEADSGLITICNRSSYDSTSK